MQLNALTFAHRHNQDGSFDSICPQCFATVAKTKDEALLAQFEREHICDPYMLDRFGDGFGDRGSSRAMEQKCW